MDLSNMSVGDLRNLQEQIKQEMKKREVQEVQKAREQILAIAQSVGVSLKDLMATTGRQKIQWGIAILVVLLYALIPVAWMISLSVKSVVSNSRLTPSCRRSWKRKSSMPARTVSRRKPLLTVALLSHM